MSHSLEGRRRRELFDHMEDLFTAGVLSWSAITESALRSWFEREGTLVYRLLMLECGIVEEEEEEKEGSTEQLGHPLLQSTSDTLLRKYLVLLLQVRLNASFTCYNTEGTTRLYLYPY